MINENISQTIHSSVGGAQTELNRLNQALEKLSQANTKIAETNLKQQKAIVWLTAVIALVGVLEFCYYLGLIEWLKHKIIWGF